LRSTVRSKRFSTLGEDTENVGVGLQALGNVVVMINLAGQVQSDGRRFFVSAVFDRLRRLPVGSVEEFFGRLHLGLRWGRRISANPHQCFNGGSRVKQTRRSHVSRNLVRRTLFASAAAFSRLCPSASHNG
jgi:hypothetical protein